MRERMDAGQEGGKARRRQSWGETGQGRQDWGDRTGWMQVNVGEDVCSTGSMYADRRDAGPEMMQNSLICSFYVELSFGNKSYPVSSHS